MKSHRYTLERHEHGWLFCAAPLNAGIPMDALSECMGLFPKSSVMNSGIPESLNRQDRLPKVVMAVGVKSELAEWEKELNAFLADRPAEERWWCGTDTGSSSSAMFVALCSERWKQRAWKYRRGDTPKDADDFGRCKRLLDVLPEWKERLPEVAAAYPQTRWPAIILRWDEIANAKPAKQTEILQSIPEGNNPRPTGESTDL